MLADALEHLVRGLVPNPDDVRVRETDRGRVRTFEVREQPWAMSARKFGLERPYWGGDSLVSSER